MSQGKMRGRHTGADVSGAVQSFLGALAERAAGDHAFAEGIADALRVSGLAALLTGSPAPSAPPILPADPAAVAPLRHTRRAPTAIAHATDTTPPDPYQVLRERGAEGLRAALATEDLTALRQIIRQHRLDPARVSARWTAPERLVALIVEQTRARLQHGRAFERV